MMLEVSDVTEAASDREQGILQIIRTCRSRAANAAVHWPKPWTAERSDPTR
jgi:hypothetical protein